MTLKANPQKMSPTQTVVVVLVGLGALLWGGFALLGYNPIAYYGTGYPQVVTVAYVVVSASGAVFLVEIFTEQEILNILD